MTQEVKDIVIIYERDSRERFNSKRERIVSLSMLPKFDSLSLSLFKTQAALEVDTMAQILTLPPLGLIQTFFH